MKGFQKIKRKKEHYYKADKSKVCFKKRHRPLFGLAGDSINIVVKL